MSMVPQPNDPITDEDRQLAVEQVQRAMADGEVRFAELDDRFEAIYAAQTRSELEAVWSQLPSPPAPAVPAPAHPIAPETYSVFGDVKVGGWISVGGDLTYGSGFGNVTVDLSSAHLRSDCTVRVRAVFGDVTVILPDGVRASMESTTIFGDRTERLTQPVAGLPYVRVVAATLFGDAKLYSLSQVPEGKLQRLWKALRGR